MALIEQNRPYDGLERACKAPRPAGPAACAFAAAKHEEVADSQPPRRIG